LQSQADVDREADDTLFPWWGYLIANAVVWTLAILVFVATKQAWFMDPKPLVNRPAVSALLIFVPLAFLIASIYDFCFDRIAARTRVDVDDEESAPEAKATGDES